ncbi:alpha/beta-type small acid-soluble spore protein [Domibacillus robiginosus]|uniref:alpha/beta-type small acid-soluble spore protein n=1 Tax=Domibacillus robiginosus TaxID=1071054 RepID=UPI00067BAB5D|nr:alpha/beta-type small acid-soluble spore protein [Domibacillus robiginosus]
MSSSNRNRLLVPGARQAVDPLKQEIAAEFGVQPGADAPSRVNGEITKRLVQMAKQQLSRH